MLPIALALLLSAASLVSADCDRNYTVKAGDYCDLISAANNASTYQIAVANYQTINDACTNLDIGQNICLGNVGQDCQAVYSVMDGDSCETISTKFGLNSTLLLSNNPQIDDACDNIYVSEVLCVSTTYQVTPAPAGWTMPGASLDDGSASSVATASLPAPTATTLPDDAASDSGFDATVTVITTVTVTAPDDEASATASATVSTDDGDDDDDDDCDDGTDDTDDGSTDDGTTDDGGDDCNDD